MKPDGEQGTPSLALLVLMARLQRSSRFSSYTSRTAVRLALRCVCYGRKQQMIEQGDSSTLPLYLLPPEGPRCGLGTPVVK